MTVLISALSRLTLMAMIAFEVTLNGKRVCIAGAEDLSVLNAVVTASGRLGKKTIPVRPNETYDVHYTLGGLTGRQDPTKDVHLRWRQIEWLKTGDIVQIKIIETNRPDRPKSRTKARRKAS